MAIAVSVNCISAGTETSRWCSGTNHTPGEKMFVDWAGDTVPIYDRQNRPSRSGLNLCGRAGRQHVHVCASHPEPEPGELD